MARKSPYCYPNSNVLINKLDIRSGVLLEIYERKLTAIRDEQRQTIDLPSKFDVTYLCSIHQHLFQDIYDWAGRSRTVPTRNGATVFSPPEQIESRLSNLFEQLESENYLTSLSQKQLVARLSFYLAELNNIHPFRDGNGRTQRNFINALAKNAGYILDFSKTTQLEMKQASMSGSFENLLTNVIEKIPA